MRFEWSELTLEYADHPYNTTLLNERAVELPIAQHWLTDGLSTLEVGNVLAHYNIGPPRTVVDRYEQAPSVSNLDVFDLSGEWQQIVSISTLEHVRWDEPERDPDGAVAAICHLLGLLSPGGRMLVTVPGGYHPHLDRWLSEGAGGPSRLSTMVRDGGGWVETDKPVVRPYGETQPWAETVWVVEWCNRMLNDEPAKV